MPTAHHAKGAHSVGVHSAQSETPRNGGKLRFAEILS